MFLKKGGVALSISYPSTHACFTDFKTKNLEIVKKDEITFNRLLFLLLLYFIIITDLVLL